MSSIYKLNIESHKVFFRPERLITTIQDEIFNAPWFGHKEHVKFGLTPIVNDAFALFGNDREVCYCTLFSLINSNYQKLSSYYFPFILTSSEPADPPQDQMYVILKCLDQDLYLYEAEHNKKFIMTILDNLTDEAILNTEKKAKILFDTEKDFKIEGTVRTFLLRNGQTSNVLYRLRMDSGAYLFKSYRRISSMYEEAQLLKVLEESGFKSSPKMVGKYSLGMEAKFKVLGVLVEYIQNNGTLQKYFSQALKEGLKDKKKQADLLEETKTKMKDLGQIVKAMHKTLSTVAPPPTEEEGEEEENVVSPEDTELYQEFYQIRLSKVFEAMETTMIEAPPKEEELNAEEEFREGLEEQGKEQEGIREEKVDSEKGKEEEKEETTKEKKEEYEKSEDESGDEEEDKGPELIPVPGPLEHLKKKANPLKPALEKVADRFEKVTGKKKQKIHQHLDLSQIFYDDNELYIADFLGDPTRQGIQRIQFLPVEVDISSLLYSLSILVNSVKMKKDKFLTQWKDLASTSFLEGYGKKDLDEDLINLFCTQKAVSDIAFYATYTPERVEMALQKLKEMVK
jgi:predicted trehalose synthase